MELVLSILWWIFVVLVILLAPIVLLLFYPFKYRLQGEFEEQQWVKLKVYWLFHLIGFSISYEDADIDADAHFFWKRTSLAEFLEEPQPAKRGKRKASDRKAKGQGKSAKTKSNSNVAKLGKMLKDDIVDFIKTIFRRRRKNLWKRLKIFWKILTDEQNQKAYQFVIRQIIYYARRIAPKKGKAIAAFSTGSPDSTAVLYGVMAFFPVIFYKGWQITPDFEAEEKYFRGCFDGRGRIYLIYLVMFIWKIASNDDCARLFAMIDHYSEQTNSKQTNENTTNKKPNQEG